MSVSFRRTLLRGLVVLGLGVVGLVTPGRSTEVVARAACTATRCDWNCSLLVCIGNAECPVSGSCVLDESCGAELMRVICGEPLET